ncbi:hypothetical protein B0I35DRAFT_481567 [Stachybotrys elegans]|uniref:ZZ-type domain-containing protein n=1 Tax=Stachybotrys elegans TaxID=80388 RepID=A0A8K0SJY5_9HYPO|nr:hypothetical protein B0I35DRAFT_481567 [Stachybotrys elegans]
MALPRRSMPRSRSRSRGTSSSLATPRADATGSEDKDSDTASSDSQGGWSLSLPTSTGYTTESSESSDSSDSRSSSVLAFATQRMLSLQYLYLLGAFLEGRAPEEEVQVTGAMQFQHTAAQVLQNKEHAGLRSFLDAGRRGINEHLVLRLPPPLHHRLFIQAVFGGVEGALQGAKQWAIPVMAPPATHWPSQAARRAEHLLAGLCYFVYTRCQIPGSYFPPELAEDLDRAASGFDDKFRRATLWAMLRTMLISDAGPYSEHDHFIMVGFCAPPTDAELEVLRDVVGFLHRTERPLKLMLIVGEDIALPFDAPLSVCATLEDNPSLVTLGLEADLLQWYSSVAEERPWLNMGGVKQTLLPVLKRVLTADPLLAISYLSFTAAQAWTSGTGLKRDPQLCATRLDLIRKVLEAVHHAHRPLADHILGTTAFARVPPLTRMVNARMLLDGGDGQDAIDKLDLLTGYAGGAALLGALDHIGRRTAVVLYLLERGQDSHVNDSDNDGWTPLHWACRQWDAEVVRLLVHRGADRSMRTSQGWLPWHVAIYHKGMHLEDALMATGMPAEPGKPSVPAFMTQYWCSSCFVGIFGEHWNCNQCTNFDHCFKCHGRAAKIHEPDHTFTCYA